MDHLSESLAEGMAIEESLISFNLFGLQVNISETVVSMWIVSAIIIVFCILVSRLKLKTVPGRFQAFLEMCLSAITNFTKGRVGSKYAKQVAPFLLSVIIFLGLSNIISVFSFIPPSKFFSDVLGIEWFRSEPFFELRPPTKDLNVPFAMSLITVYMMIYYPIKLKGLKGYGKAMISPMPIMLPFKLLDYAVKPLSLTLRLFGNVLAAYIIMEIIHVLVPVFLPAALCLYFDFFDGLLQAFVFVFLSSLYIGDFLEDEIE